MSIATNIKSRGMGLAYMTKCLAKNFLCLLVFITDWFLSAAILIVFAVFATDAFWNEKRPLLERCACVLTVPRYQAEELNAPNRS
jgi:hypothetical protein